MWYMSYWLTNYRNIALSLQYVIDTVNNCLQFLWGKLGTRLHPCLREGDSVNSLEIYFKNEENKRFYMDMIMGDKKVLIGDDTDDYIAQG